MPTDTVRGKQLACSSGCERRGRSYAHYLFITGHQAPVVGGVEALGDNRLVTSIDEGKTVMVLNWTGAKCVQYVAYSFPDHQARGCYLA